MSPARAEALVTTCFVVALLAALALAVVFWQGGQPQVTERFQPALGRGEPDTAPLACRGRPGRSFGRVNRCGAGPRDPRTRRRARS
jgi:hypothetical protein